MLTLAWVLILFSVEPGPVGQPQNWMITSIPNIASQAACDTLAAQIAQSAPTVKDACISYPIAIPVPPAQTNTP